MASWQVERKAKRECNLGRKRAYYMKIPNRLNERGLEPEIRREFNKLLAYVRTIAPKDSSSVAVSQTEMGAHIQVKPSARGGDATPRWG